MASTPRKEREWASPNHVKTFYISVCSSNGFLLKAFLFAKSVEHIILRDLSDPLSFIPQFCQILIESQNGTSSDIILYLLTTMTSNNSPALSHTFNTRPRRNPGNPKMNGGQNYPRFGISNKESTTSETKLSTPGSPSSSSGHNSSITVAERRQTQVSKYLVSEDFKSDFATKLNRLRQRERNMTSSQDMVKTAADQGKGINEEDESREAMDEEDDSREAVNEEHEHREAINEEDESRDAINEEDESRDDINAEDESQDTDNNNIITDTTSSTTDTTTATIDTTKMPQTSSPGRRRARIHEDSIQVSLKLCSVFFWLNESSLTSEILLTDEPMMSENLQEAEEEGYTSPTSNQEEQSSSRRPSCYFGDEDPEEQSARYEVISKLADQLAEQIEENDSLLYELGVVRSNNARLQAVAADKEDEVACLNQRNRQLENTVTQLNCSQPAEESAAEVLRSQLNQIRGNLCQLLAQGDAKHQSPGHHNQIESESVTKMRQMRRYSWSSAQAKCFVVQPDQRLDEPACPEANKEGPGEPSGHFPSAQAPRAQGLSAGWTGLVDLTDRESMRAHILWLQAELISSRSARMETDAALQSIIDSIAPQTQRPNAGSTDMRVQGLGLFTNSTPVRPLRSLDSNSKAAETPNRGSCPVSVSSISEEPHNRSSPLLALASFGFSSWGRKPDSGSSPKQIGDEEAGIPSSNTTSEQNPAAAEKEAAYPFKRFGLRSFFNHSTGGPLSKSDAANTPDGLSTSPSLTALDISRKSPSRSLTLAVMPSSAAIPTVQDENVKPQPIEFNSQNAPLGLDSKRSAQQLFPLTARHEASEEGPTGPSLHTDDHLLLNGGVVPDNSNAIII
ncbi:hypothetical protein PGTUg99_011463 [Puccinia graminis f. sp. tritici]|uniref:Uncharacterized protein n=1 Tax=Puccinia graminis f. sp. tritici TaxID=56615 RepID=A0A5B0PV68_PUCGR|nr:hypothetical protein PGTUg99_011463 [Puccinia graminis f. sp. tritici]